MKFSIVTCCTIHVAHKGSPLLMTYKINGGPLKVSASHTYLGIGIINMLSWASMQFQRQIRSLDSYVKISIVILLLLKKLLMRCRLDRSLNIVHVFGIPITRSKKISLNRFNIELQDLYVEILDAKAMSVTC